MHYNEERLHQGIDSELVEVVVGPRPTRLEHAFSDERLSGLLSICTALTA